MTFIACIGSRETPDAILKQMEYLGELIVSSGYSIATGNCKGADQAFARGGNKIDPTKVSLFLPWHSYERDAIVEGNWTASECSLEMEQLAEQHHPAWPYLSAGVKKLMSRNAAIIDSSRMGKKLVIAYLNLDKKNGGGTGHGWRIATHFNFTKINLRDEGAFELAQKLIAE